MDSGIITGIITLIILGGVFVWIFIASRQHEAAKKKTK